MAFLADYYGSDGFLQIFNIVCLNTKQKVDYLLVISHNYLSVIMLNLNIKIPNVPKRSISWELHPPLLQLTAVNMLNHFLYIVCLNKFVI